eukprot:71229_1
MCDFCSTCCYCCYNCAKKARHMKCHIVFNGPLSARIDIFDERLRNMTCVRYNKILILGSGSVGKSAVFKSLKRVQEGPLTDTDLMDGRHVIRQNIIAGVLTLLKESQALYEHYNDSYTQSTYDRQTNDIIHGYCGYSDRNLLQCLVDLNEHIIEKIQLIVNYARETFHDELEHDELQQLASAVDTIWNLPAVQQTFLLRLKRHYSFPENMDYFYNKTAHAMSVGYVPTEEDIHRLRVRTTGTITYEYEDDDGNPFEIRDVGGERNERKKWIHSFENVACVVYVCSLNQYCLSLFEDEKQIGLLENMTLFGELCNSKWFRKSVFVLLLNKIDLFRDNLRVTPLTFCFGEEYKGRNFNDQIKHKNDVKAGLSIMNKILIYFQNDKHWDKSMRDVQINIPSDVVMVIGWYFDIREWWLNLCYEDGIKFITQKFIALNQDLDRTIHVYEVCAIVPDQIGKIMHEVQALVLQNDIKNHLM